MKHDAVAAAHVVEDKAAEVKQDTVAAAHVVEDKAKDAANAVQGKLVRM